MVNGQDWAGHAKSDRQRRSFITTIRTARSPTSLRSPAWVFLCSGCAAVGDYDNDASTIFITALGQSHLLHNNGNGTFKDVTAVSGLWGPNEFSTSAAWLITIATESSTSSFPITCSGLSRVIFTARLDGAHKSYCTPESYRARRRAYGTPGQWQV